MRSDQGAACVQPAKDRVVAVMQPYLYPYAGYFRLLLLADVFIILDDVQFPRRGRVHRCEVPNLREGGIDWLTLPVLKGSQDMPIRDLAFTSDARRDLDARLGRFPWLAGGDGPLADKVRAHLYGPLATPCDFVEAGLVLVAEALGLRANRIRSSALGLDRTGLRGRDYILALVRAVNGSTYINAPGGRALYDSECFAEAGLELRFLEPYRGRFTFLLPALLNEDAKQLRADIVETAHLSP